MIGSRPDEEASPGDQSGKVSRRVVLTGGLGLTVAGLGALAGPRLYRRAVRSSLGINVSVPTESVPVRSLKWRSLARGKDVVVRLIVPTSLAHGGPVPVCVWLHGRGDGAATVVDELKVPNFLSQAIGGGVTPFVVVALDGGERYWHRRQGGEDPEAMVVDELPLMLEQQGIIVERWAIAGWSMGGYGALLLAERHPKFSAVAVSSPAVWFRSGDTRPGAFDSAEDFASHDVLASLQSLPAAVRIDCGLQDPFASTSAVMLARIPGVHGAMVEGAHTMRFWRSVLPAQLAFLGRALAV